VSTRQKALDALIEYAKHYEQNWGEKTRGTPTGLSFPTEPADPDTLHPENYPGVGCIGRHQEGCSRINRKLTQTEIEFTANRREIGARANLR
jgi:hypothetical protein